MNACFDHACVELDRGQFLRLTDAGGATITCLQGCLWITRDGSPADIELAPGQSYWVENATRVIATGFEPSLARVWQPAAPPPTTRPTPQPATNPPRARQSSGWASWCYRW